MRASGEHTPGLGDEVGINIIFAKRHVGTVLTIEDQREVFLIPDAEDDKCCQTLRIGDNAACIHAFARKFAQQKAPHMLVANAGYESRFETKPCGAGCNIGGRTTNIFVEGRHILEKTADLCAVKIYRRSANRNQIKPLHPIPPSAHGSFFSLGRLCVTHITQQPFYF